jgi:GNAT superfamily N-acetyltransferase
MITITKGTLRDVDVLSVLFDAYRQFYGKAADLDGAVQFLKARMVNNEAVIFLSRNAGGEATGFVQLYPIFSSTRMTRLWLLNDLFVSPEFRGAGISVALINQSKVFSKETTSCGLVLETEKSNMIGNNLYARTGFILDEHHNYYSWTA